MPIDIQADSVLISQEKIKSIIEKRLIQARADVKAAAFPKVLKQNRVLSAIVSQPEYLMIVFLTTEEEKRCNECISMQTNPFVGLITTGPEKAVCRVEKAICASARSCTVTDSFGFSLSPDSTIFLEDHRQLIQTSDMGIVSYTVPLAYIASYGDTINSLTVYEHLESLIVYSTNMWKESAWLTNRPGDIRSSLTLSQLQGIRN